MSQQVYLAKRHYAECDNKSIFQNVVMLSLVMLSVVMLNVIMLDVVAPNIQQVGYFSLFLLPDKSFHLVKN
jgi:hypothetical protein